MKLSLIIPCYNEKENLPLIFSALKSMIQNRTDIEIILVDNGSTDGSADAFKAILEQTNTEIFKVVTVVENKGYGYGILEGLKHASGDVLGWTHADMQTDPKDVLTAFELFRSGDCHKLFVKGKRLNRRLLDSFLTFGMQLLSSLVLGTWFDDINAQPKLFPRHFYQEQVDGKAPNDFSLDLFILYQAKRLKMNIETVPVIFADRLHGEAKGGGGSNFATRWKLIKRSMSYIFELKKELHP